MTALNHAADPPFRPSLRPALSRVGTSRALGDWRMKLARRKAVADPLAEALRAGDEQAFAEVVDSWSRAMLHVARGYVSTQDSAEEVVQDTWLAVIKGLDGFEGRSSLRTWVFRILVNIAKTRGVRESRTLPFASLSSYDEGPTVDPSRFYGPDGELPGAWTVDGRPQPFEPSPEAVALAGEVRDEIEAAITTLPERQRIVLVMRDVQGLTSDEVCDLLDISAENQRVLLHRGRAKVRALLESYYRPTEGVSA